MKKYLIIILALLLSLGLCLGVIASTLKEQSNNVKITKEVVYGNEALAKDYTVLTNYQYNNQLFWKTEYNINGEYNTKFSYFNSPQRQNHIARYTGINIPSNIEYEFSTDIPANEQEGISKVFKEMHDKTKAGGFTTRTIKLKDYYTYYPFSLHIDLPDINWSSTNYSQLLEYGYIAEKEVCDRFYEFFKIPVLENDTVTLTMENSGGGLGGVSMGMEENCYFLGQSFYDSPATHTKNRAFFAINNLGYETKTGQRQAMPNLSQIEGGYGIYSVDFRKPEDEKDCGVIASSLKTALPLNTNESVIYYSVDKNEEFLIVITSTGEDSFIYVMDIETNEVTNKLSFEDFPLNYVQCKRGEDYFLFEMNGNLLLIEKSSKGYEKAMYVEDAYGETNYITSVYEHTAVHYENGTLAIADSLTDGYGYERCGFYLALYKGDGLVYFGKYHNSIDKIYFPDNFSYNCFPADFEENVVILKQ